MSRRKWKTEQGGVTYRSGFEAKTAKSLALNKVKFEYEVDKFKYTIPESSHTYTPDFSLSNGVVLECKGRFTPADRKKMSLVIEQNPDKDIRLLFMVDNTLSKASKTTYTMWCDKRGILSAVSRSGDIPKDWLKTTKGKTKQ